MMDWQKSRFIVRETRSHATSVPNAGTPSRRRLLLFAMTASPARLHAESQNYKPCQAIAQAARRQKQNAVMNKS
jgi:hypothetical protein